MGKGKLKFFYIQKLFLTENNHFISFYYFIKGLVDDSDKRSVGPARSKALAEADVVWIF